jgi:hypothetical protein
MMVLSAALHEAASGQIGPSAMPAFRSLLGAKQTLSAAAQQSEVRSPPAR